MRHILPILISMLLGVSGYAQIFQDYHNTLLVELKGPNKIPLTRPRSQLTINDLVVLPDSASGCSFFYKNLHPGIYILTAEASDFETVFDTVRVDMFQDIIKPIRVDRREYMLPAVKVKGQIGAVVYKGDTIQFNPMAINKLRGDMAREILEQMPGVEIDERGITVFGNLIDDTYVNGRKIFGDDTQTAFDHIESEEVIHIQAYEDHAKTRKNGQNRWALNIITRSKMINSTDAKVIVSAGKTLEETHDNNMSNRYAIGGVFNFFSEDLRYSANLMQNNENVSSSNSLRFLQIGRVNPFYSKNSCAGLSLDQNWKERKRGLSNLKLSYQYTSKKECKEETNERTYNPFESIEWRRYKSLASQITQDKVHCINIGTTMLISNEIRLKASASQTFNDGDILSQTFVSDRSNNSITEGALQHNSRSDANSTALDLNLLSENNKVHWEVSAFGSKGAISNKALRQDSIQNYEVDILSKDIISIPGTQGDYKYVVSLAVGKHVKDATLSLNYKMEKSSSRIEQMAWNVLADKLDSVNTYNYRDTHLCNSVDAILFANCRRSNISLRAGIKHDHIYDDNIGINKEYSHAFLTPSLSFSFTTMGTHSEVRGFGYDIVSTTPDIVQLRSQLNNANRFFISTGNPNLKAKVVHRFFSQQIYSIGEKSGATVKITGSFDLIKNNIVSKTSYYTKDTFVKELNYWIMANSSLSTFVNASGGRRLNLSAIASLPISSLRTNISFGLHSNTSRTPFYFNGAKDVAITNYTGGFASFCCNKIPLTRLNVNGSFNYYNYKGKLNTDKGRILDYQFLGNGQTDLPWKVFLKYDYKLLIQNNLAQGNIHSQNVLNLYLGRHCFKQDRGEISIIAYDVLGAYNNRENIYEQNYLSSHFQTNYGRFVCINFTWTFRKYKSSPMSIDSGIDW